MKYIYINPFSVIACFIFSLLVYEGIKLIFFSGYYKTASRRFIFSNIKNGMNRVFDDSYVQQQLKKAGLRITIQEQYKTYQQVRYIITIFLVIILFIKCVQRTASMYTALGMIVIYVVSIPVVKIGDMWTPFGFVMKELDKDLKKKQDFELSSIIIQLQNIALSQQDEPTTLSYMLTRVVRFSQYTKVAFIRMISFIDQAKEEEAKNAFIEEIDTPLSRDLAYVLIKLDSINPAEVVDQFKILEERVKNDNITNKNQKEEFYSNIFYLLPTALCFVILLNFLKIILGMIMNFSSLY